jgi:spore maturation protein CgeB
LTADEHYIALDPEGANLGDAVTRFRDPDERQRVAEAAYALVKEGHTYRDRIAAIHQTVAHL